MQMQPSSNPNQGIKPRAIGYRPPRIERPGERSAIVGMSVPLAVRFDLPDGIEGGPDLMEAKTLIEEFVQFSRHDALRPLRESTIHGYKLALERFVEYLAVNYPGVRSILDAAPDHVKAWRKIAIDSALSPTSVIANLTALRGFYLWAGEFKNLRINPMIGIRNPRKVQPRRPVITIEDATRLLSTCAANPGPRLGQWGIARDRAILALCLWSGQRIGSIAALLVEDIDLAKQQIFWRYIKGGRKRGESPIHDRLVPFLQDYLRLRPQSACDSLFISRSGGRLGYFAFYRVWYRVKRLAGLDQPGAFHKFRRLFATMAHDSGVELLDIMDLLFHSDPSTTQKYIARSGNRMKRAIEKINFPTGDPSPLEHPTV